MADPTEALMVQFLTFIAEGDRSYSQVMEAWRTACPRMTIWEDALIEGLVQIEQRDGGTQREARVALTALGRARLAWQGTPRPEAAAPPQAPPIEPLRARSHIG